MTPQPLLNLDWQGLAPQCGALQIACLNPTDLPPNALRNALEHWLNQGNRGTLDYIDARADILVEPFLARPWAKAALILTFAPERDDASPLWQLPQPKPGQPVATIAAYAMNRDYHLTGQDILRRLKKILEAQAQTPEPPQFELCVDTRPVMEKELAVLANLGQKGLNSLVRNQTHGSQIHLAVAFTSIPLPTHIPKPQNLTPCSQCGKCLERCPNKVFGPGDRFAVSRCRAWLTAECRGPLDAKQQKLMGNTLFGCGLCTAACPATIPPQAPFHVDPCQIVTMPSRTLQKIIAHTALEHAGTTIIKRNAVITIANQSQTDTWERIAPKLAQLTHSETIRLTIQKAQKT